MDWYEWLLLLHVLSAFALMATFVTFGAVTIASWRVDRPSEALAYFRVVRPAGIAVAIAAVLVLIFGVWLAIYVDGYELWDAWIAASIVLWVVSAAAGQRGGQDYVRAQQLADRLRSEGNEESSPELRALVQSRRALVFNLVAYGAALVILVLMIYKPGA